MLLPLGRLVAALLDGKAEGANDLEWDEGADAADLVEAVDSDELPTAQVADITRPPPR